MAKSVKSATGTRRRRADAPLPPGVTKLSDGRLEYRRRWPVAVVAKRPDRAGKNFARALGGKEMGQVQEAYAKALLDYAAECKAVLEPSPRDQRAAWVKEVGPSGTRDLRRAADQQTGLNPFKSIPIIPHTKDGEIDYEAPGDLEWVEAATDPEWQLSRLEATREHYLKLLSDPSSGTVVLKNPRSDSIKECLRAEIKEIDAALARLKFPGNLLSDPAGVMKQPTIESTCALFVSGKDERYAGQIAWAARLFTQLVGDKPISEHHARDLNTFETGLAKFPTSTRVRTAILAGELRADAAIAQAEPGSVRMSPKTVGKHVDSIKAISAYARNKGIVEVDPFVTFKKDRIRPTKVRHHFIPSEIDAIFKAIRENWIPHAVDRAWISVLALFHGLRREEVCQLQKGDVRQSGGIWCLHITSTTDEDDEANGAAPKKLKTAAAERVIPLHASVVAAGFPAFAASAKGSRIFESLTQDADGRWGGNFGKRFGELRAKAGIGGSRERTFHGFRHTAITAMRDAAWPQAMLEAVVGHTDGGSSINKAYGTAASAATVKPYMDALTFGSKELDKVLSALASHKR